MLAAFLTIPLFLLDRHDWSEEEFDAYLECIYWNKEAIPNVKSYCEEYFSDYLPPEPPETAQKHGKKAN